MPCYKWVPDRENAEWVYCNTLIIGRLPNKLNIPTYVEHDRKHVEFPPQDDTLVSVSKQTF